MEEKAMTREELIDLIKREIEVNKDYPNFPILDALEEFENEEYFEEDFELVAPMLEIIGTHPEVDFGIPGELVRFVEKYYGHGYEELLIESVRKHPTLHNIWMIHRCFNVQDDSRHQEYKNLIEELKKTENLPEYIYEEIDRYDDWDKWDE